MLPTQVNFSEKLRFAVSKRDIAVSVLATNCGIPRSTLYRMMSVESPRQPQLVELVKISIALGLSMDFFVGLRKFEDSELPFPWGYKR